MRTLFVGLMAFVAMGVFVHAAAGQTAPAKPDFSGRWTIKPAAPGTAPARGDMGSGWGSTIAIEQDSKRLTVEYEFFARSDLQPPLRFVYALDGSETRNSVMMGRGVQVQTSKTRWDGDKLVITTIHTFTDPASGRPMTAEVKQTLSLESPTSLVVETMRAGVLGGPSATTRTTYVSP
ncbi:exported hypothetical protein [Candidatus Sulfopaludibacter sp. SbA3]|nr:exported hypothetical protein [Candidatus Sulfopaludibacter sp. SbA3]